MGAFGCEGIRQDGTLFFSGYPGCGKPETILKTLVIGSATFLNHSISKLPGGFEVLRVIHCEKGLKRCIGAFTPCTALFAGWRIKGDHGRRRRCAFPEEVQTSPIQSISMILSIFCGVARGVTDGFPNAGGLIRTHAASTHLQIQQTTKEKRVVTELFCIEAITRAMGEQAVCGIECHEL